MAGPTLGVQQFAPPIRAARAGVRAVLVERVVAAYLRASGKASEKAESPEQQLGYCQALAGRDGARIGPAFVFAEEEAITATDPLVVRSGFQDLLRSIQAGLVATLYLWSLSRTWRNPVDAYWLAQACLAAGTLITTQEEGSFDLRKAGDMDRYNLYVFVHGSRARHDAEACARGKRHSFKHGYWAWGLAPYGYKAVGPQGQTRLEPDEHAHTVRQMFLWYAEGWSGGTIARELNRRGELPRPIRGARPSWARDGQGILHILRNRAYIGWNHWTPLLEDPLNPPRVPDVPFGDGGWAPQSVVGGWPPLVDLDLWNRVQRRGAEQRKKHPGRAGHRKTLGRADSEADGTVGPAPLVVLARLRASGAITQDEYDALSLRVQSV